MIEPVIDAATDLSDRHWHHVIIPASLRSLVCRCKVEMRNTDDYSANLTGHFLSDRVNGQNMNSSAGMSVCVCCLISTGNSVILCNMSHHAHVSLLITPCFLAICHNKTTPANINNKQSAGIGSQLDRAARSKSEKDAFSSMSLSWYTYIYIQQPSTLIPSKLLDIECYLH